MDKVIARTFEEDEGFIGNNKFKVVKLERDECILEYEIEESGLNTVGMVHGGLLFGLADTCAGVLSFLSGRNCVTTSANIDFLNPAKSGKLYAKATILKEGKSIGYYSVEITDENDRIICTSTVNMYFYGNK